MTAQLGKDLLIKTRSSRYHAYETVMGLRAKTIILNANPIDITSADSSGQWREFLAGGVRDIRIEGQGLFTDSTSDNLFRTRFFANQSLDCQIIIPDYGTISGAFMIAELQYLGDYNGEMNWRVELHSSGVMSFVNRV